MANKLQADLIMIQGNYQGKPISLEVSDNDEIRFILNDLDNVLGGKELLKIDSMQFRGQANTLQVALFILGSQAAQFEIINEFIKQEGVWYKSPVDISSNLMGYFTFSQASLNDQ